MVSEKIDITIKGKNDLTGAYKSASTDVKNLAKDARTMSSSLKDEMKDSQTAVKNLGKETNTTRDYIRKLGKDGSQVGKGITSGAKDGVDALKTISKEAKDVSKNVSRELNTVNQTKFSGLSNNFKAAGANMVSTAKSTAKGIADSFTGIEGVVAGALGGAGLWDLFNKGMEKGVTQVQLTNRFGASTGSSFASEYAKYTAKSSTADEDLNNLFQGVTRVKGVKPADVQGFMNAADAFSIAGDPIASRELRMGLKDYLSTGSTKRLLDDLSKDQIDLLDKAYASGDPKEIQKAIETIAKQKGNIDAFGNSISNTTKGPIGNYNKALTMLDTITREATKAMDWLVNNVIGPIADTFNWLNEESDGLLGQVVGWGIVIGGLITAFGLLGGAVSKLAGFMKFKPDSWNPKNWLSKDKSYIINAKEVDVNGQDVDVSGKDVDVDGNGNKGNSGGFWASPTGGRIKTVAQNAGVLTLGAVIAGGAVYLGGKAHEAGDPVQFWNKQPKKPTTKDIGGGIGTYDSDAPLIKWWDSWSLADLVPGGLVSPVSAGGKGGNKGIMNDIFGDKGLLDFNRGDGKGFKFPSSGDILNGIKKGLGLKEFKLPTSAQVMDKIKTTLGLKEFKLPTLGDVTRWIKSKLPSNLKFPSIGDVSSWIKSKMPSWLKFPTWGDISSWVKSRMPSWLKFPTWSEIAGWIKKRIGWGGPGLTGSSTIGSYIGTAKSTLSSAVNTVKETASTVGGGVYNSLKGAWNWITGSGPGNMFDGIPLHYENYPGMRHNPFVGAGLSGNCVDMSLGLLQLAGTGDLIEGTWNGNPHVWARIRGKDYDPARKALEGTWNPPARGPLSAGGAVMTKAIHIHFDGEVYGYSDFKKKVEGIVDKATSEF